MDLCLFETNSDENRKNWMKQSEDNMKHADQKFDRSKILLKNKIAKEHNNQYIKC